ncbi:MAG: site-specific DNA-methyltransferase [Leptolyngbyaceae cyanobacterium SM2_5_2]|nr:site-specific DNA-methyltransferase [Leptolyngbyaceae cyanobacterium SM2_5_2]
MKPRAPKNRTLDISHAEQDLFAKRLINLHHPASAEAILGKTICQDLLHALAYLPNHFIDLLIVDPPYNLNKDFNGKKFRRRSEVDYENWLNSWIPNLKKLLKPTASAYFCADWRTSIPLHAVLKKHFSIRSRITWEREKGRGASTNWKNTCEDIWFCTVSENYYFDVEAVKLKRQVIAPYRTSTGKPKDWDETGQDRYRLTHPSNLWTDITVPFWSMSENTDHPTQKPEKLIAKLILASSNVNDVVFDPFLGSGTTSVVAKKLGRQFVGVEIEPDYCCLAEKRLALADLDTSIQGYSDGVFWERNTLAAQQRQHNTSFRLGS